MKLSILGYLVSQTVFGEVTEMEFGEADRQEIITKTFIFCSANLEYCRRTSFPFNHRKDRNRMTILVAWWRKDLKRLGCEYWGQY